MLFCGTMWKLEDDLFICHNWEFYTVKELSKILGKTKEDVRDRIKFFKLRDCRYEQSTAADTVAPHYWYYKVDELYSSELSLAKASNILGINYSLIQRARVNVKKGLYK